MVVDDMDERGGSHYFFNNLFIIVYNFCRENGSLRRARGGRVFTPNNFSKNKSGQDNR